MTRARTVAERALASMRGARPPEQSELVEGAQRRRMVARLEGFQSGLLREDHRRRRVVPWLATGLAVAVAAAVGLGLTLKHQHTASPAVVVAGVALVPARLLEERGAVDCVRRSHAGSERELFPGDELRTHADATATLELALGAKVRLGPSTEVELLKPGAPAGKSEAVRLVRGEIQLSVPKQPDGASFSVTAPLAKVIVLGTAFSVTASERGPTTVQVTQGRVLVEHGTGSTFLTAGATWTSAAPFDLVASPNAPGSPASSVNPAAADSSRAPAVKAQRATPPLASSLSSGTLASNLAQQNELLMSALAARRSGNDRAALAELESLLERYPHSASSEEATVERFRALARLGRREEARSAARQYLARRPNGFAADEARALALDGRAVEDGGGP